MEPAKACANWLARVFPVRGRALEDALARAEAAEARLRSVVDAMPEGVVLLDNEGRYVLWNRRYSEIYHRSADLFAPGVRLIDALRVGVARGDYPEAIGCEDHWLGQRAAQLLEPRDRHEQQLSDGSWLMIEDRVTPDGGLLGLRVDITRMKQQAQALEMAVEAAEAASRAKSEFVANISHEIRTPLHGILGLAQVLERSSLSDEQRHKTALIRSSGDVLLALLNDLLDLAKIEAGRMELEAVNFSLAGIVEAACAPLSELASQKGVALEIELGEASLDRCGDPVRVQQVITNLVSNAVKFTEAGRVTVSAQASGAAVTLVVADTGIGIPADRVDELFQKFVQVEASTTRRFGGSGLGLAISRQLVELMGGSIAVTSAPEVGSTFVVRLPLKAAPPAVVLSDTAPAGISGRRLRILAAEDNPTNRLILHSLLEPIGVDLTLVANGQEAVESFVEARFDLVLMDIQMPLMDGVAAAREIRKWERANSVPPTPIVALSANAMEHQVAEYQAAGMDDTLSKPFTAEGLCAAIQRQLAVCGSSSRAA
jgi:signal transduction histidine kinase